MTIKQKISKLLHPKIHLNESDHQYILDSDPSFEFGSVTETIGNHFKPFDRWKMARILTSNSPNYMHLSAEELVGQWNRIRDQGTRVHKEIENYIVNKKRPSLNKAKHGIKAISDIRKNFGTDLFSEVIVYSTNWSIAGIIDLIAYNKNNKRVYIFDWKTTKNLYKDNRRYGITPMTRDIRDTNYNKYTLQLSAYKYLLEKSHNVKVHSEYVVHLKDRSYEIIPTEYQESKIENIFNERVKIRPRRIIKRKKPKPKPRIKEIPKGPTAVLRKKCKRLSVRLTRDLNGRRVYKTDKMLERECSRIKREITNNKKGRSYSLGQRPSEPKRKKEIVQAVDTWSEERFIFILITLIVGILYFSY